jgi:hypothetical protein
VQEIVQAFDEYDGRKEGRKGRHGPGPSTAEGGERR